MSCSLVSRKSRQLGRCRQQHGGAQGKRSSLAAAAAAAAAGDGRKSQRPVAKTRVDVTQRPFSAPVSRSTATKG